MPAVDQTPTFKLNLPTFDLRVWHTYVNENFSVIDSVLQHYLDIENLVGVWRNATEYHAGERAVDVQNGAIYECLLDNVSAAVPTTFAEDRAANTAYWGGFTVQEDFKGTWQNSTPYSVQDFVVSGNIYAVCLTSHTSIAAPGVFGDDAVYWIYLINLAGNVLPSITGHGGAYIRARPDETAVEYRTPTQVKADLGISNVVTSWNTRIGDVTLTQNDIINAGGFTSAGGTITGALSISGPNGTARAIYGFTGSSARWDIFLGNGAVESGSNVGSDFVIQRFNDAGTVIDVPLTISRASGAITTTGALSVGGTLGVTASATFNASINTFGNNTAAPTVWLNGAAGTFRVLASQTAGAARWALFMGDATAEGGSNAGSNFSIQRYNDAGTIIDAPLTINRANGFAVFSGAVTSSLSITVNTPSGSPAWYVSSGSGGRQWNFGNNAGTFTIYDVTAATPRLTISAAGVAALTGDLTVSGGATAATVTTPNAIISGSVGTSRLVSYSTSGSLRWTAQADGTAEGGANAGSNYAINAWADNGSTNLGQAFNIVRATRVVTFAVAIVNPSDIRLKTHISPITNALEVISKMQAIWYREKAHPEISKLGLIAQDVRKILPEVVHETADMSDDGDAILGIDYSKIVPMLVEAVKELSARVATLEARQ